jgi:DNA processing protein
MTSAAPFETDISPAEEMIAYEILWSLAGQSEKGLAALFGASGHRLPSQLLQGGVVTYDTHEIRSQVERTVAELSGFSLCVNGMAQYPQRLRDAQYPVELFYYQGDLSLTETRSVSIVGARKATTEGKRRAMRLARELVWRGFTIVSGLAKGIDTAAMTEAMQCGGRVIGVIGTPITEFYPRENQSLQQAVGRRHLLISQVPFHRYKLEPFENHRFYFPRRNVTMAALSEATIIVEASDTSGTLTQARACMQQGRKLFILDNCFQKPGLVWPGKYEKRGAIRVRSIEDIVQHLPPVAKHEHVDEG